MTQTKKEGGSLKVKAENAISDGEGGYLPVGAKFTPVDGVAAKELKARGLAE